MEDNWIDVNAQLPKTDGRFMVTIKGARKSHVEMCNFDSRSKRWMDSSFYEPRIIAWQSRPAPFEQNKKK